MKDLLKKMLLFFPIKWQIFINFRIRNGYFPNFEKPKSFNEKVQVRKLYDDNPLFVTCSDKYLVREFVGDKIGFEYLIPLIYVGEDLTVDILKSLKKNYVVKTTHDSGNVFLVKENESIDYNNVVHKIRDALKFDFGSMVHEPWYSKIEPKVIIEEMLLSELDIIPNDYKFHVFNSKSGNATVILGVDFDRFTSLQSRSFFDEQGNSIEMEIDYPNRKCKLPNIDNLNEMFKIAKVLGSSFDYVRVDLYSVNNKIFFGELTFAMASGFAIFKSKEKDFEFGSYWDQN
jgi:hypothetical protein